jgi:16S rRNA (adenine1518-N6/adenine1519-N6)-dimethyltransferase
VRVTYHPPSPAPRSEAAFDGLVRSIFMQRRKMLTNALAQFATSRGTEPGTALAEAGIDGRRRPETLTVAELVGLADVFASASLRAVL